MKTKGKLVIGAIALPLLGYLGACGWMYARQRELIYFPQATKADASQTDFGIARNGVMLNGWLVNIGKPKAVIYFGGNAERIEEMRDEFARWFPDSSSYLVPYRGYGASEGEPSQEALLSDALAVFDQVQARQPGAPVTVIGRSLGSAVASYVASQRPVARLALVTPFDSLANVAQAHYPWLPARWIIDDAYPSTEYLAKYAGPLLVIRAGRDAVVPPASTDRLLASLQRPAQVVDLPQADHASVAADPRYGQALAKFVSAP
ncbi:MAG TPA: alpha/beta fold hydrolase [Luteimonas sp.]|nr:alpha/beta fold hydrolase [Luteimonas sp.]